MDHGWHEQGITTALPKRDVLIFTSDPRILFHVAGRAVSRFANEC